MKTLPRILLLTGPAGAGKSTLAKMLSEKPGFQRLVSYTTRAKRASEIDGEDYQFISAEQFSEIEAKGKFIEFLRHEDGTGYGMPFPSLDNTDIIWVAVTSSEGVTRLTKILDNKAKVFIILINAPDKELHRRMVKRGDSREEIKKRTILWDKERSTGTIAHLEVGKDSPAVEVEKILSLVGSA